MKKWNVFSGGKSKDHQCNPGVTLDYSRGLLPMFSQNFLEIYDRARLLAIERHCAENRTIYEAFRHVYDDDLWNVLLLKEYSNFPHIRRLLPDWPPTQLQINWVGNFGFGLGIQTVSFYKKVKDFYKIFRGREIKEARLLDFGCGWGRIIRYFAKDIPEESIFGCDPNQEILKTCLDLRVPGTFRKSDFRPHQLPFSENFDLVYSFSVFTHLSEQTHMECLEAIHHSMAKDGILIVTFRPREFIHTLEEERVDMTQDDLEHLYHSYDTGGYAFLPHYLEPIDGDITYGDAIISLEYIHKKWTKLFSIIGPGFNQEDFHQVPLVMKKR